MHMSNWRSCASRDVIGIVICNYFEFAALNHGLNLTLGDRVRIIEENGAWYRGWILDRDTKAGIFPKNCVHVKAAVIESGPKSDDTITLANEGHVAQEIYGTLREWRQHIREMFLSGDEQLDEVRNLSFDLVELRKQILSGALPSDELRHLQAEAVEKLDKGNAALGLDTVIRNEDGTVVDLERTSLIDVHKLFKAADLAVPLIKSTHIYVQPYCFVVSVKNFGVKVADDCELIMSLYDETSQKFVTENCVLEWKPTRGFEHGGKVVFVDLKKIPEPQKMWFVCQIVRKGPMEWKETAEGRKSNGQVVRRPLGVAVGSVASWIERTDVPGEDEAKGELLSVVLCGDSDSLFNCMKKAMGLKPGENRSSSVVVVTGTVFRGEVQQVREAHPHLFVGSPPIGRILGYPDVIIPADVRNDIYVTLERGEFHKNGRNVEVSVSICDERGVVLPQAVCIGVGVPPGDKLQSIVYYHDDRPRWAETLKVSVGFEQFDTSHLRFFFKHRSSTESKDKAEKPFALAYLPLKNSDGTALADLTYRLAVYRIDQKKFTEDSIPLGYLEMPSEEQNVEVVVNGNGGTGDKKPLLAPTVGCYVFSAKEIFQVTSLVCSTKLTQNFNLLGLLKWKSSSATIRNNLDAIPKMTGPQVLRFLQDILDVLFDILSHNSDPDHVDALVVRCLVHIINEIKRQYPHFRPVLDAYIKDNFFAAMAYHKLIHCLSAQFADIPGKEEEEKRKSFIHALQASEYLFKFIVQSRLLYAQLNQNQGEEEFKDSMISLLKAMAQITENRLPTFQTVQSWALKSLPAIIPDLLRIMESVVVSRFFGDFLRNVEGDGLSSRQLDGALGVVESQLFRSSECRKVLLPLFCEFIHSHLLAKKELTRCADVLNHVLVLLAKPESGSTHHDLGVLVESLLRDIVKTVIHLGEKQIAEEYLVILLSIFRQMTKDHYRQLIGTFDKIEYASNRQLLQDFLQEIFVAFKSLFSHSMFPREWSDMIMLQNTVILKALQQVSLTIHDKFLDPFDDQLWSNFFQCAVAFCTQESLQLENFSAKVFENWTKNDALQVWFTEGFVSKFCMEPFVNSTCRYDDMRLKMSLEVRSMWNSLGSHKRSFVPDLVSAFLDLSLIPVEELRRTIIPLFFDMMQFEYRLPKYTHSVEKESATINRHEIHEIRLIFGKLEKFHHEMMKALDAEIEGGRGDVDYVTLFEDIMLERCMKDKSEMKEKSLTLVRQLVQQMRLLFEYRDVMTSPTVDVESRMGCTVNLLEYYDHIHKREMYIRYLYKLRDLHLHLENYTEVAFTLEHHARMLLWTDENLSPQLKSPDFPEFETHRELKEKLFYEMIKYFDKGKSWEYAINRDSVSKDGVFKELATLYETDTYDYAKLSALLKLLAEFYDKIINPLDTRVSCEYFRVAYYGQGFPVFWRNKAFVYRGKECENLRDFTERQQNRFPGAITMKTMDPPDKQVTESDRMFLQICRVEPVPQMEDRFGGKAVSHRIRGFFLSNDINTFTYHRRLLSGNKDSDFANMWLERTTHQIKSSLPGILRWSQITSHSTTKISPIQAAIETLQAKNDDIFRLVEKHEERPDSALDPQMSAVLAGVLDPAVNGGIANYEKAFLSIDYRENHPENIDQVRVLENLIGNQIPLLEGALEIYGSKVEEKMRPHYEHLYGCFRKQKTHVESHYGGPRPPVFGKLSSAKRAPAVRSYSTLEPRKSNTKFYRDEAGSTLTLSETPPRNQPKRSFGSLSTLTLSRSSRESTSMSSVSTPVALTQELQSHRPRRDSRGPRPGSGSFQNQRRSSLFLAEEDSIDPTGSPPPLPEKKSTMESSENGLNGVPRRRKTLGDGIPVDMPFSFSEFLPEKPPMPNGGLMPDLPPKNLRPNSPRDGGSVERSPSRFREGSATPPPVPQKPAHLLRQPKSDTEEDGKPKEGAAGL